MLAANRGWINEELRVALGAAASAAVTVSFPDAERYSDAGNYWERDRTVDEIRRHLQSLGERYLPPSQTLKIEVLDIDLAGHTRYFFRSVLSEVRILNGRADFPSIKLRYVLESGGKVSASAEETVADMDYLNVPPERSSGEPLRYEVKLAGFRLADVDALRGTVVTTSRGVLVPLGELITVREREVLFQIRRENQQYERTVAYVRMS